MSGYKIYIIIIFASIAFYCLGYCGWRYERAGLIDFNKDYCVFLLKMKSSAGDSSVNEVEYNFFYPCLYIEVYWEGKVKPEYIYIENGIPAVFQPVSKLTY